MHMKVLALVCAFGFGICAVSANAASPSPPPHPVKTSKVTRAANGCGHGKHLNSHKHCVWNHQPHAHYRYHSYPYYGGGYGPSARDHVANKLNAQEARHGWVYWGR